MIRWLVLWAMLWPATLFAQSLPALYDVDGIVAPDTLNVRAGPSTEFEVINKLTPDATGLEVVDFDDSGTWAKIGTPDYTGWVSLAYMRRQAGQPDRGLPNRLQCAGVEPFWSFRIAPDRSARFDHMDTQTEVEKLVIVPSENRTDRHALFGDGRDKIFTSLIARTQCTDGASDRTFGLSIDLLVTDEDAVHVYSGCCSVSR